MEFTPSPLAPPKRWLFVGMFAVITAVTFPLYSPHQTVGGEFLGDYLTVVWSLPFGLSTMVLMGAFLAHRDIKKTVNETSIPAQVGSDTLLIVQLPTIGRFDVIESLQRVVASCEASLPRFFANVRIDVIAEERSEARLQLLALASQYTAVHFVENSYRTFNGTERKARANCWANDHRIQQGEAGDNVWILHMDDDTGIGEDTAREMARFIHTNPAGRRNAKHLVQGVLTYPRQYAVNGLTWLADAVRPSSDLSIFRLLTGGGSPLAGAHGELLLVRSSIERQIGWDFGRKLSITEDANFALLFAAKFPGRSAWFAARCYGGSPATMKDLMTQRKRWARGLLHVVCNPALPIKQRALLGYAMSTWVVGPMQHIFFVLLIAALSGDMNTSPVTPLAIIAWAANMASGVWLYVEGLMANTRASGNVRPKLRHWLGLLLMPYFSLVEGIAGMQGGFEFIKDRLGTNKSELFEVIAKPYKVEPLT